MKKTTIFTTVLLAFTGHTAWAQAQQPGNAPAAAAEPVTPPAPTPASATAAPAAVAPAASSTQAADAPTVSAPAAPATSEPAAAPPAAPAAAEAPTVDRITIAKEGFFQPIATLQGWFFESHQKGKTMTTFRIRRAELGLKGDIIPKTFSYKVVIDPAKTLKFDTANAAVVDSTGAAVAPAAQVAVPKPPADTSILNDVYLTYNSEYADVSVGQFKIPVSYEGFNSSSKLLFPERDITSRQYGDRRDLGLRIDKKFDHFGYNAGIFNGQGLNQPDQNNGKDLALRLEAYPIKGITIAAVGYTSVGSRKSATTKDRVEGDLRFDLSNALLQAEYIRAWDGPKGARLKGQGGYVALGYTFFDHLQPVVRLGILDTNIKAAKTEVKHYEFGANYYVLGDQVKFQGSFSLFDPSASATPNHSELILATQLSF